MPCSTCPTPNQCNINGVCNAVISQGAGGHKFTRRSSFTNPPASPSGYAANSVFPPGSFDGMFKPLPPEVKVDIESVLGVLSLPDSVSALAFNRLMAELHILHENRLQTNQALDNYRSDLNSIDRLLNDINVPHGATVDRVRTLVQYVQQAVSGVKVLFSLFNKG